ncbi:MAG: LacI family DNA-binding transcriptional regulator [Pseudomonadota bacterium]
MARRRQSVTIKHVAADAGVSLQTVSRVINDEPNVRPAMKERVQSSIDKLGYVPSIAAQRMSGSRSYLILALNDRERTIADWRAREGNDWVDQMLLGGMLKCTEHGYRMLVELVDTHSDHVERELSAALASLQPDGVILTPPHSDNPLIVKLLARENVPFVRIGSLGNGDGIPVSMDDEGSARLATEHLIKLGHERIGFVAGPDEYSLSQWRVDGWLATMAEQGLATDDLLAKGDFSFESGKQAGRQLLSNSPHPTAIIASNDQMTHGVLEAAKEFDLDVPRHLSLISFDNSPSTRFTRPALTAIDQPVAETAARAVELIIAAQKGKRLPEERVVVPGRLIKRSSVSPPLAVSSE